MGAADVLDRLAAAGLSVELLGSGAIGVSPSGRLTDELRALIRSGKAEILAALSPPPQRSPEAWRGLAKAYHLHHFGCRTCISAGQGRGLRCGVGTALWAVYLTA
jgi:hypothetical protein